MKMYYEPNSRITVGNVVFNNVNRVVITESVKELGDKAVITLPRNYKTIAGKGVLDFIKTGDPVTIELGYDGKYWVEFTGFLDEIEAGEPLILHVDDGFYPLKRNSFNKAFEKASLREVLEFVSPGYTVDCPDADLGAFDIPNVSSYKVYKEILKQRGFYARINDKTIKCWWAYDFNNDPVHTYQFGNNVKKNNLKYHRKEDIKLIVKGIANQRNGKKLRYEFGDTSENATIRSRNFGDITMGELKQAVESEYKLFAFDGYSGSITGFAYPRTHAGETMKVVDPFAEDENDQINREGNYLIEKTIIVYDLREGYERENTLSFKV